MKSILIWVLMVALITSIIAVSGCAGFEAFKSKRSMQQTQHVVEHAAHLQKDSSKGGVLNESQKISKSLYEGERITYRFSPFVDSAIKPQHELRQPATVIVEKWAGSEDVDERIKDSSYFENLSLQIDSRFGQLELQIQASQKDKLRESKGSSFLGVAGSLLSVVVACCIIFYVIRFIKRRRLLTIKTDNNEQQITGG
jgi:hypothetical protein